MAIRTVNSSTQQMHIEPLSLIGPILVAGKQW